MKNAAFWVIKPSSYLTGNTLLSVTEPRRLMLCKMAVSEKNAVFWEVMMYGFSMYLVVPANVIPSSLIFPP
jgi:hypothetical protein